MANKVSFIIQLQDRYSASARKIKASTEGITRSMKKMSGHVEIARQTFSRMATSASQKMKILGARIDAVKLKSRQMGRSMMGVGTTMTAAMTLPLVLIGRSFVNAASDAEETANKFAAVFDDIPDKASKVASDFAKKFKLADSTAKKFLGTTGDLLVGFGFTGDEALVMAAKINELALDLDSFQNLEGGVQQATNALTRSLSGEAESLKSLGIVVNQNNPKFKKMLKLNLQTTRGDLVKAKALTILQQSFQQTQKAQGDYLKTLDISYAGTLRKATQANIKMGESFGKVLLPFANKAVKVWEKMATALSELSPFWKTLIVTFAAILAVAGPLVLVVGALAIAFGFISLPILLIVAAIALAIAAFVAIKTNWVAVSDVIGGTIEQIGINFGLLWDDIVAGGQWMVDKVLKIFDLVTAPARAVKNLFDSGVEKVGGYFFGPDEPSLAGLAPPVLASDNSARFSTTPTRQAGGRIDGNITVAAAQGSEVRKTQMKTEGHNFSLGMNMAGAAMGGSL